MLVNMVTCADQHDYGHALHADQLQLISSRYGGSLPGWVDLHGLM